MSRKLLWLSLLLTAPLFAADPAAELQAEIDGAMLRLADAGLLPSSGSSPLRISRPARAHHELGAVLDLAGAVDRGAEVLAVTPGGAAERLGLRRGDRVRSINAVAVGRDGGAEALRAAMAAASGGLVLVVERDGQEFELRGAADTVALPGYELLLAGVAGSGGSSCGRINVFDVFPRSERIYPVIVIDVDGRGMGFGPSYRLSHGRHVVTVAELIDTREFSGIDLRRKNHGLPRDHYKQIEIDVQPGVTYRLAARFHRERRHEIFDKTYWDPIVWSEVAEPCN